MFRFCFNLSFACGFFSSLCSHSFALIHSLRLFFRRHSLTTFLSVCCVLASCSGVGDAARAHTGAAATLRGRLEESAEASWRGQHLSGPPGLELEVARGGGEVALVPCGVGLPAESQGP